MHGINTSYALRGLAAACMRSAAIPPCGRSWWANLHGSAPERRDHAPEFALHVVARGGAEGVAIPTAIHGVAAARWAAGRHPGHRANGFDVNPQFQLVVAPSQKRMTAALHR